MSQLPFAMAAEDIEILRQANAHLEHPSLAARLSNVVGTPVEVALQLLPKAWYGRVHGAAEAAIHKALQAAVGTLHRDDPVRASEGFYRAVSAATGAAGGLFGIPGMLVELPVTTTLMMRAIADIARSEGENIHEADARRACVEVFALGGRAESDDAAETGYYGVRLALAMYTASARRSVAEGAAAGLMNLIGAVASRFGVALSQGAAVRLVPVVGAAAAAGVNVIFMRHFQDMARHHFAIRRLERRYGKELVQANYERVGAEADA